MPPVLPMLAKSVSNIPTGGNYSFEGKFDGFRCLVFKDGDEVELASRNTKPLTRYFPEVVGALREALPDKVVLDGEIFVAVGPRLKFEVLQERIHPAASRIAKLSEETPAAYVAFDLLALDDQSHLDTPLAGRRTLLERVFEAVDSGSVRLSAATTDPELAREWFTRFEGAGLDGVVAKPLDAPYAANKRTMLKIKHERTADVVLVGYREHKTSTPQRPLIGSLLLGLWQDGHLQHVGVSASFTARRRAELYDELQPLVVPISEHPWAAWEEWAIANPARVPGTQSRWSQGKDLSFTPLRPERVLEVGYDHMEGRRFRHTAPFKRWRPDRDPESCTYEQLEEVVSYDLAEIFEDAR